MDKSKSHEPQLEASAPVYQPQSECSAPVYVTAVPVEDVPHATVTAYGFAEG
jgi:hypothetical protein